MRATRASRALAALYQAKPQAALSVPEVAMALDAAGVVVNRVTVYRQFRLAQGSARMQAALRPLLRTLAQAGHENLAVDIAVHGLCAGCAHPEGAA